MEGKRPPPAAPAPLPPPQPYRETKHDSKDPKPQTPPDVVHIPKKG